MSSQQLHGGSNGVYLDRFTSFPHLPKHSDKKQLPPLDSFDLSHTGISSTKFEQVIDKATYPDGRITSKFKQESFAKLESKNRELVAVESKAKFGGYKESTFMEFKLAELQQTMNNYAALCDSQCKLQRERYVPSDLIPHNDEKPTNKKKKTKRIKPFTPTIRERRVYNQSSMIECCIDNCNMSLLSEKNLRKLSASTHRSASSGSIDPNCESQSIVDSGVNGGINSSSKRNILSSSGNTWHSEALQLFE
jgi:hypothetical protein